MSADRIPSYMFINEQTQELFDKRIKQRTEYDTSTSVPVKMMKKSINNTINFQDELIDQSAINQICYSSKFGLLIILTKQGILIIDNSQYQELLLKSSQNSNKKYKLKDLASRIIKTQNKTSKIFLTPDQSKLLIINEQRLVLYDLDTLSIQFNSLNQNKITNIVFTEERGDNFMGWSFYSKAYSYQKKDKQVIFRQVEDIQHCTSINFISQHIVICEKIQENNNTRLMVFDKKGQNLIKQHSFQGIGSSDNYLLQFCFPIYIFKINVNTQDPVSKNITQKQSKQFADDDIYGIILAYYDQNQQEPDHRYLNFIKGNLTGQSTDIQFRGQQLFLSPSDQRQCYWDQEGNRKSFDVEVVQLGHFFAISMTKLEGVFVVDSLLQFEDLNIFALNANHEIRESAHSYLKGICAMRNLLQFQRKPPKFDKDNKNKTCEMICGKFKGQFMSLYFSAKQTQVTVQFPASIIVLAKNKLIRKYAVSTVNGIEEDNVSKIQQQIAKRGGKSSQLINPQKHKFQSNKSQQNIPSNQAKKVQQKKQGNQSKKEIKKQEIKQKQNQKVTQLDKKPATQLGNKPATSLDKKPATSLFDNNSKKPVTSLFDNNSNKSNLFANSGPSSLFNNSKIVEPKDAKSKQDLNKVQKNVQQSNKTESNQIFGQSASDNKLSSTNLFQKKASNPFGNETKLNIFQNSSNNTNNNIFGKSQEGSSIFKLPSSNKPNIFANNNIQKSTLFNTTPNLFQTNKNTLPIAKPQNKVQKQKQKQPQTSRSNPFQNLSNSKKQPSQSKSNIFDSQTQTKNIFGKPSFSSNNMFNLPKDMNMMTNIPEVNEQDEDLSKISKQKSSLNAMKKQDNSNKLGKQEIKNKVIQKPQEKTSSNSLTVNLNKEPQVKKQTKTEEKSIPIKTSSSQTKKQQNQKEIVKKIQSKPLQKQKQEQKLQPLSTGKPMTSNQLYELYFGKNKLSSLRDFSKQQRNTIYKQMAKAMNIPIQENKLQLQHIQEEEEPLNLQQKYERIKKQFLRNKNYTKVVENIQKVLRDIKYLKSLQMNDESFFTIRNAQKCLFSLIQNPQMQNFLQGNSIRYYLQKATELSKVYKDSISFNRNKKTGHRFGFTLDEMQNQTQLIGIKLTTFENQIKKLVYSYNLVFPGKKQPLTNFNRRNNSQNNSIYMQTQAKIDYQQKIQSYLMNKANQYQNFSEISRQINSQLDYKIQQRKYQILKEQEEKQRRKKIKSIRYNNQASKGACFKFSLDDISNSSEQEQTKPKQQNQEIFSNKATEYEQKKSKIISNLIKAVNKPGQIRIDLKPKVINLSEVKTTYLVRLIDEDQDLSNMTEKVLASKENLMRSSLKKRVDFLDKVPKKQELTSKKLLRNHEVQSQNFEDERRQGNDNSFSNSQNSQQQDIVVPEETNRQISFSPQLFVGNKKQPKKQIKASVPSLFGSQINIKKTVQKEVFSQKNSTKDQDKMKSNLKAQNNKISEMFNKKPTQSKQKIPQGHKPLTQMFSSGTFGPSQPSLGLFGNQNKDKGQKKSGGLLNYTIGGGGLSNKQQGKQKPKQQSTLFKDSKIFGSGSQSIFGSPDQKQKNATQTQIKKQINVQTGKIQVPSKIQNSGLFNNQSKGSLFGPKPQEKKLQNQSKALFENKQTQKSNNLFGGTVNKGTLFSNQPKQKAVDNIKKENQQKKPSLFGNAGKPKQLQQKKQKGLVFGSPQFSQHFNKQKQPQKKQENKTGLFNNNSNTATDSTNQQKKLKFNQNSQNLPQANKSISDDAKIQQKINNTQANNLPNNNETLQTSKKNQFESSSPGQNISNAFNNLNAAKTSQNTQSSIWGSQNTALNQPNHGISTFGAQNKFMTGNAPTSNQQSAGFNPNAVSFSGGGFGASNNLKSFSSFNNTNSNNNLAGNIFNQQQPTTNNQPMQMNTMMSNSQNNSFGQSNGLFGNNNQNNSNISQSGFFQSNPQQQPNGNFLSTFNPSNQGVKAPVAPTQHTHLYQPRK